MTAHFYAFLHGHHDLYDDKPGILDLQTYLDRLLQGSPEESEVLRMIPEL